jgi:MFS family permease
MATSTDEHRPLLRDYTSSSHNSTRQQAEHSETDTSVRRSEFFIFTILIIAIFALSTGDQLQAPAQTRIFESIYCRQYYNEHDPSLIGSDGGDGVAEEYCKNHVIQGEVAMLRGWQTTIEAFVMLLVSVPWGYAADVCGRKPVVFILTVGAFLRAAWIQIVCWFWRSLPIKAVWGSAGFVLLGGGDAVTIAIVFTIVSDVVPEERRASKYFLVGASAMLATVIGPFASAALMVVDPWIPMILGLALQALVIVQVLFLPETKNYSSSNETAEADEETVEILTAGSVKLSPLHIVTIAVKDSISFLTADTRILLLIPAFFMHMLVSNTDILQQYISTRYGLSLADATFVLTLRSAWVLALLMILYPALNHLLRTKLKVCIQAVYRDTRSENISSCNKNMH